jgi:opacity protein-like surface antigen
MKKFNKMLAITAASILTAGSAYAVDVFESVEATGNVDVNVGYTSTTTEPSSTSKTEKTAYAHEGNSDMDGYVKLKGNMWGITLEHEDDDFTPKLEFTPKKIYGFWSLCSRKNTNQGFLINSRKWID